MNKQTLKTYSLPLIRGKEHKFSLYIQTGSSPVGSAIFLKKQGARLSGRIDQATFVDFSVLTRARREMSFRQLIFRPLGDLIRIFRGTLVGEQMLYRPGKALVGLRADGWLMVEGRDEIETDVFIRIGYHLHDALHSLLTA